MSFKFKRATKDAAYQPGFIDFDNLIGTKAILYYHNKLKEFQLGRMIFEVIEDEDDGYRSSLDKVNILTTSAPLGQKLAEIEIKKIDDAEKRVFHLCDTEDNDIWLEFGTDNWDDYYPCYLIFIQNKILISNFYSLVDNYK